MESMTLSYNVPKIKGIEGMRVYLSGNNLFVITPYKGLDPEIATANNEATPAFIDLTYFGQGYYPKYHILLKVKLRFLDQYQEYQEYYPQYLQS